MADHCYSTTFWTAMLNWKTAAPFCHNTYIMRYHYRWVSKYYDKNVYSTNEYSFCIFIRFASILLDIRKAVFASCRFCGRPFLRHTVLRRWDLFIHVQTCCMTHREIPWLCWHLHIRPGLTQNRLDAKMACHNTGLPQYHQLTYRLSVCLSVTRVDQPKTVEARITQFSPYSSSIPLVFRG